MDRRYTLTVNNQSLTAYPLFGQIEETEGKEQGQVFARKSWGQITFKGDDYNHIKNSNPIYEFTIVEEIYRNGEWRTEKTGTFHKVNCRIDEDKKEAAVKPKIKDRYTDILDYKDKEYNVLEFLPAVTALQYQKTPILQVYVSGSTVLTNILEGRTWEQEVSQETSNQVLKEQFYFGDPKVVIHIHGNGLVPDVSGGYDFNNTFSPSSSYTYYQRESDDKYILVSYGLRNGGDVGQATSFVGGDLDDQNGLILLTVASTDLDDSDFNSVWSVNGGQIRYIGKNDDGFYCFKSNYLNGEPDPEPPSSGTLTHVSGATHTDDVVYSLYTKAVSPIPIQYRWAIYDVDTSTYVYVGQMNKGLHFRPTYLTGTIFTSLTSSSQCRCLAHIVYTRALFNEVLPSLDFGAGPIPFPAFPLKEEDIVPETPNYKFAAPINATEFIASGNASLTKDIYGTVSEDALHNPGYYFTKPTYGSPIYPINLSQWGTLSLWFYYDTLTNSVHSQNKENITVQHAYRLNTIISTLLGQFAPNITFEDDSSHSDFLYGGSNVVSGERKELLLVPKSNIIYGAYDMPAREAKIRFSDIEVLLKGIYNAKWDIQLDNKMRIEHIRFFYNGKNYSASNVGQDLTQIIDQATQKAITEGADAYGYEETEIPEFLKWEFMDRVSSLFEGQDLECIDPQTKKGTSEDHVLSLFVADLDYLITQPETANKDGFVILECTLTDGVYVVNTPTIDSQVVQNGRLTVKYIQETYFKDNAPTQRIKIDGTETEATSVRRTKIQEIETGKLNTLDLERLVTTGQGSGLPEKVEKDKETGKLKITIRHETK